MAKLKKSVLLRKIVAAEGERIVEAFKIFTPPTKRLALPVAFNVNVVSSLKFGRM
jgi:hypothetical protein